MSLWRRTASRLEKAVVEKDGAQTVEAIEVTVVLATSSTPSEEAPPAAEEEEKAPAPPVEEVLIWGIPLVGDERSETVLIKFLRAWDLKVKESGEKTGENSSAAPRDASRHHVTAGRPCRTSLRHPRLRSVSQRF